MINSGAQLEKQMLRTRALLVAMETWAHRCRFWQHDQLAVLMQQWQCRRHSDCAEPTTSTLRRCPLASDGQQTVGKLDVEEVNSDSTAEPKEAAE